MSFPPTTETIHIVRLDGIHLPSPTFSPNLNHTYTEYPLTTASEVASRLLNATVAITTTVPITRSTLVSCPTLKLICAMAIGTNQIDLTACRELGVTVCNVPAASNESVAEHAISSYFALRRRTVVMHEMVVAGGEWEARGSLKGVFGREFPGSCREEVVGIVGVGELGNRVANHARALGMKVLLLDRKDSTALREDRILFTTGLSQATVLIITCPLNPSTINLISTPELALMRPDAILINVARGGIVDEEALVLALKEDRIMGAATDVFLTEPATKENSVLVRAAGEEWARGSGRLVLSPHVAWCAQSSIEKLRGTVTRNVEGWVKGEPVNLVV